MLSLFYMRMRHLLKHLIRVLKTFHTFCCVHLAEDTYLCSAKTIVPHHQEDFEMKRTALTLLVLLTAMLGAAQKVYRGNSSYNSDIVCHIEQGKVYRGQEPYTSSIIARFDGTSLYSGNSVYSSDILLTYRSGKIYRGRSTYDSDVLATWRDGKMFRGRSVYQSDVLFTYKDNKVYRRNEPYQSSILLRTSANVHPIILFMLLSSEL